MLDHIPELLSSIAGFVDAPEDNLTDTRITAKARELGALRHSQQASIHQLLREFELLRNILESFVVEETGREDSSIPSADVIRCLRRINQALAILSQTTVDTFVERYDATIAEHARKLGIFTRMASHEIRQPLSALSAVAGLLRVKMATNQGHDCGRILDTMDRSVLELTELIRTISKASSLASTEDAPGAQRVSVSAVAQEAARRLREFARMRNVEIFVEPGMPHILTEPGQLELIFLNLLSNAVKYSDPSKTACRAEVRKIECDRTECLVVVRDNGLGMDQRQIDRVFTPYFRGHARRDAELHNDGMGLGLSIVRDCAAAIGATVSVESVPQAFTAFTISLPLPATDSH
ncbi:MAG: HAMP domain-containing sensor histidine kinase [Vicinamibacterales bacterium]